MNLASFPLYVEKLFSSASLSMMTPMEFGIYCRILFMSYIQKNPCFIENNHEKLRRVAGCTDLEWEKCHEKVLSEFKVKDGYLYNEVLLKVYKVEKKKMIDESGDQLNIKASLVNYPFEQFWKDYDKKVGSKERLIKKWLKLTPIEREAIRSHLPKYKDAKPDKQYRRDPKTYLNNKTWLDEIINKGNIRIDNHGEGAAM